MKEDLTKLKETLQMTVCLGMLSSTIAAVILCEYMSDNLGYVCPVGWLCPLGWIVIILILCYVRDKIPKFPW
jgi:hypothetical protein